MKTNQWVITLISAIFLLGSVACSEATPFSGEGDVLGADIRNGASKRPVHLILESANTLTLGLGEQTFLEARVVYADDGRPATNHPVSWSIPVGASGSLLGQFVTQADSAGKVVNTLMAGQQRTNFQVQVSAPSGVENTVAQMIDVRVDGEYGGSLRVSFEYSSLVPLAGVDTRLHRGLIDCDTLDYNAAIPIEAQDEGSNVSQSVTFGDLTEGEHYSVTVFGMGPAGNAIARGCAVSPAIVGNSVVNIKVTLESDPVTKTGTYEFGTQLRLQEALPEPVENAIAIMEDVFINPIETLLVVALQEMGYSVDASTIDAFILGAEALYALLNGGEVISFDDLFLENMPPEVLDIMTIGGDVTHLLTHLQVGGQMTIDELDANGGMAGHWEWTDFLWQWRHKQGCDFSNTCCGRTEFSGEDMGLAPIGSNITGTITEAGTLAHGGNMNAPDAAPRADANANRYEYDFAIDNHALDVQYGALIGFAVNQFVLPAMTGENVLDCAIESSFGCNGAGEFSCGSPNSSTSAAVGDECGCAKAGAWLGNALGSSSTTAGQIACDFAIGTVKTLIEAELAKLSYSGTDDYNLQMSAEGVLADADKDLHTDLIDAVTTGTITASSFVESFSGEMVGDIERTACVSNSGCGDTETCQVKFNPLNDCSGRLVCLNQVGDRGADRTCTQGSQCATGVCLEGGRCFEACSEDSQCSGNLSCAFSEDQNFNESLDEGEDIDGDGALDVFKAPVVDEVTMQVNACMP
jgi:hypothetical protein